jgi:hypothetical protein
MIIIYYQPKIIFQLLKIRLMNYEEKERESFAVKMKVEIY